MTTPDDPQTHGPGGGDPITLLDVTGHLCPMPALKTLKALRPLAPGMRLKVLATDPLAEIDIPHLCREQGHRLLTVDRLDGRWEFLIEKMAP